MTTGSRAPRLLALLAQSPFDPSSGAARSTLETCLLLARRGWQVQMVASSATESGGPCPVTGAQAGPGPIEHVREGVRFLLFPLPPGRGRDWERLAGDRMGEAVAASLHGFAPDLLLTFGGTTLEAGWRQQARATGARVVFALHNEAYVDPRSPPAARAALQEPNLFLTPSDYLARRYSGVVEGDIVALPPPIDWESVYAAETEAIFTTFVNPEPAKGLMFVVRLFDELARHRPDIPLRVVESRAGSDHLLAAARRGGIDLTRHEGLFISPALPSAAMIMAHARILLMPSVWNEPAGRLACEAMVNGVVPLVSDRGGLPEMVEGAMAPLPLPVRLDMKSREPVCATDVLAWRQAIEALYDDDAAWQAASARCRSVAAERYGEDVLGARYDAVFRSLTAGD